MRKHCLWANISHYKKVLTSCMLLIVSFSISAQEFVSDMSNTLDVIYSSNERSGNACVPITPNYSVYLDNNQYIPGSSDTPIPIRINLIFVQRDDGSGNFQEDNEEHQYYLDLAMEHLNYIYANLQQDVDSPYCYVGTSFVENAKIRFIDNRYFIKYEVGWSSYNAGIHPGYNYHLDYLDAQIRQCDTIPPGINVYFTEYAPNYIKYENGDTTNFIGHGNGCSASPKYNNMEFASCTYMSEYYSQYWCKVWLEHPNASESEHAAYLLEFSKWLGRGLAHELGHSVHLYHPATYEYAEDPFKVCRNSIMNPSGKGRRNFLSPNQIGTIHYALMGSNLQNYVPENAYSGTKVVEENVSFPRMRFYHSLSIQADVTMNCEAIMPEQAAIHLQNGGNLTIDGGSLHSITDKWKGIVVEDGSTLILSNTSILDYNIVVENGGTLVIEDDITLSGEHYIMVKNGGCICIDENATVTLTNTFSVIELYPNALLGCNNMTSAHCVSDIEDILISGNGQIATYDDVTYIQNETISAERLATGSSVMAGYNVTNEKPIGNVIVTSSGNLKIQSTGDVILTRDVEIQQGGSLTIQTNP